MIYVLSVLGALLLGERLWKQWAVMRFFRRPIPLLQRPPQLLSILLPVVSGDGTLEATLDRNLAFASSYPIEVLFLGDIGDTACEQICRSVAARHSDRQVRYLVFAPPPQGHNPKMHKLNAALPEAHGDVICVLDDDTRLPDGGLEQCVPYLDQPGVGLAFGLPYYVSFIDLWSSITAAFVVSNSLLTYIPYTILTQPFTINGMFYVMRRDVLEHVGNFAGLEGFLADDFAIAHRFRQHGLRLAQTPLRHAISTQVRGPSHYFSLIRRWFIAPRESILRYATPRDLLIVLGLGLVPTLAPPVILLAAIIARSPWLWGYALLYLVTSFSIFAYNNHRYLRDAAPLRAWWLVPAIQILFPFQLLYALLAPQQVNWRGNVMRIERGGTFRYVQRRRRR